MSQDSEEGRLKGRECDSLVVVVKLSQKLQTLGSLELRVLVSPRSKASRRRGRRGGNIAGSQQPESGIHRDLGSGRAGEETKLPQLGLPGLTPSSGRALPLGPPVLICPEQASAFLPAVLPGPLPTHVSWSPAPFSHTPPLWCLSPRPSLQE